MSLVELLKKYKTIHSNKFAELMIDIIRFPENLTIALEQVFFKELFTIIVENEDQIEDLMQLNR